MMRRPLLLRGCAGAALVLCSPTAAAAHDRLVLPGEVLGAWNLDPFILAVLLPPALLYFRGTRTLWRRAGSGRGVGHGEAACFAAGWLALVAALVSPIDALSGMLFSVHMVQHTLLLLVAPPLLILGRPVPALYWGLPATWRKAAAARSLGRAAGQIVDAVTRRPLLAWVAASAALWAWHMPVLYDAAVADELLHALEHASFFLTALLFWWGLIASRGSLRRSPGAALLYVFTAAMQSVLLGALLTLSSRPWYSAHRETAGEWGLDPLQDQHIAGAVMWVPAGIVYLVAMLAMLALWLRAAERATERSEAIARRIAMPLVVSATLLSAASCGDISDDTGAEPRAASELPARPASGNTEVGRAAIERYGCGACHIIPGVPRARGLTGPPLDHFGRRGFIAGALVNTPENLALWIRDPWQVEPGTVMPDMGVSQEEAEAMAEYLLDIR
jgi:putative membrane protein